MTKNSKRIEDRLKERLNVLNQDESNFGCSLGQQSQVKGPLINAALKLITFWGEGDTRKR